MATTQAAEASQSFKEEPTPAVVLAKYHHNADDFPASSKHLAFAEDDSQSDEDDDNNNEFIPIYNYETIEPQMGGKRSADAASQSTGSNGENRHWAIPYRFGKRGAMPYRFGKRAAMPYRFGKRAGMHFRLGKKSAAL
ncbi:unnamed protein product [Adineta ricciae]|uniref:Uncharacterized protein n=1 Tax=Adineta ricciae TaxID=249248 RepID=A0A814C9S6_ADIRI|nr:unnamed protein product [Adineta ricciae]